MKTCLLPKLIQINQLSPSILWLAVLFVNIFFPDIRIGKTQQPRKHTTFREILSRTFFRTATAATATLRTFPSWKLLISDQLPRMMKCAPPPLMFSRRRCVVQQWWMRSWFYSLWYRPTMASSVCLFVAFLCNYIMDIRLAVFN